MNSIRRYYRLTKPGIIRGNALTAAAGFFLASGRNVDFILLLATLTGLSLIVASACVFNNYLDRDIDKMMGRTKKRALVTKEISAQAALSYGAVLGTIGTVILLVYTTTPALIAALVGFLSYVAIYTPMKRKTSRATEIGSIPGAVPPVVGYMAVSGAFDTAALLLFLLLVFWQIPHFYAIALYRIKEYAAAGIPLHPIIHGTRRTKKVVLLYITIYAGICVALALRTDAGLFFGVLATGSAVAWLFVASSGYRVLSDENWGKKLFITSLPVLSLACLGLIVGPWLR